MMTAMEDDDGAAPYLIHSNRSSPSTRSQPGLPDMRRLLSFSRA